MPPRVQLTDDARLSPEGRPPRGERPTRSEPGGGVASGSSGDALLFATAEAAKGGPAALLEVLGTSVLGRLLDQLASLGVGRTWIVTRPAWRAAVEAAADGGDVTVVTSEDVSEDLRLTAEVAGEVRGSLVIGNAHIVTHREALAGLLTDPRIASGLLSTPRPLRALEAFQITSRAARVVSAASPYHRVTSPTGYFLGPLKVDARDLERLVDASRELAVLAADRPERWEPEPEQRVREWRLRRWRVAVERETGIWPRPADAPDAGSLRLDAAAEGEIELRRRAAKDDPVPLLLVGLARAQVDLFSSNLREFFHAAPLSREEAERAGEELNRSDEGRVLLDAAVKGSDGFFTTFFVSPYSKYVARFAARRGWTPNAVSTASLVIGLAAAASFAVGTRASLIAGAVLLQVSFTVDCVDGQLARYTRTFSKLGGWLDSVFDRAKEYLVYAGLAVGSTRGFGEDVWVLAAAALTLQTVRHMSDFAYVAGRRHTISAMPAVPLEQPEDFPLTGRRGASPPELAAARARVVADPSPGQRLMLWGVAGARALLRSSLLRWGNRIVRLPIGERFALISLTAAIGSPRVTFVALLAWGGAATIYALTVRLLISYALPRRFVRAVLK
jgi:phosphatidylglycerophosphate synthase